MNMNNEFLIRLKAYVHTKEILLKAYTTKNVSEHIKIFNYMKENEIPMYIPEEDHSYYPQYDGEEVFINSITFTFGGKQAIPCLDVWVNV